MATGADCREMYSDPDAVEACEMGAEIAEGAGREARAMGDDARDAAIGFQDSFGQSARFANTVDPKLRKLAGCKDSGHGTYTKCNDKATRKHDELVDAFYNGASEQIENEY